MNRKPDRADELSLLKRYLLWLYKMTRDEVDKIDRKFTQLEIDKHLQQVLVKKSAALSRKAQGNLAPYLKEGQEYVFQKESDAQKLKFDELGAPAAQYVFLCLKLEAVSETIRKYFGRKGVQEIKKLYEDSCVRRILEDVSGRK